jgi:hypothetical protein
MRVLHQVRGAEVEQLGSEPASHLRGLGRRTGRREADRVCSVDGGHQAAQVDLGAVVTLGDLRQGADRRRAAGLQRGEQRALGGHRRAGVLVVERAEQAHQLLVVGAALDRERALRRGRQHRQRVDDLGGLDEAAEPLQARPRAGRPRRARRLRPCDAGVDVAADRHDLVAEPEAEQLGGAAREPVPIRAPGGQLADRQPSRATSTSRGSSRSGTAAMTSPGRGRRRQVLVRVDGEVDLAGEQASRRAVTNTPSRRSGRWPRGRRRPWS